MSEKINFQAEVNKMLGIVINSLYSEKYIFLRELISNASDACDKLKYLQLTKPDAAKGNGELKITITPDEKENTLTIADNGIGMNRDDLINHLGTIAKSGTADFVANMKENGSPADLIGQFGARNRPGAGFPTVLTGLKSMRRKRPASAPKSNCF